MQGMVRPGAPMQQGVPYAAWSTDAPDAGRDGSGPTTRTAIHLHAQRHDNPGPATNDGGSFWRDEQVDRGCHNDCSQPTTYGSSTTTSNGGTADGLRTAATTTATAATSDAAAATTATSSAATTSSSGGTGSGTSSGSRCGSSALRHGQHPRTG